MKKSTLLIGLFMGLILFLALLKNINYEKLHGEKPVVEYSHGYLGTLISISIYGDYDEEILAKSFMAVEEIDKSMSMNSQNNEIWELNQKSGISPVQVSDDLYEIIGIAKEISKLSNGAFDITIGPVMELWKSEGVFSVLPEEEDIVKNLTLVDYNKIVLLEDNYIFLEERGMSLDLGGIAKGYACDRVVKILRESSVESAILDFGGNVYVYGSRIGGEKWKVGIHTPIEESRGIVCAVEVSDTSVVTSGGYERFFRKNGEIYHHILDTKTGYPVNNNILSVTVIGESSTLADSLSTVCFCLGLESAMTFIEGIEGYEAIFIMDNMNVYATDGIRESVYIYDDNFELVQLW